MELNLNLIPAYKKGAIEMIHRRRIFVWQSIVVLVMIVVFGSILIYFNFILKNEINVMSKEFIPKKQSSDFEELERYDKEFKEANAQISILEEIQKGKIFWSNLFLELDKIVPDGVEMKNITTKKNQVLVAGIAGERDSLVLFKSRLEGGECFENINFPLSNFAAKENIEFQIDFFIKDNCVKKQ